MTNTGLDEVQNGIKISRRNIHNLRYADDSTLMAESEEEPKSLSMKVKEVSGKVGLKLNIQKTKIMELSWNCGIGKTLESPLDWKEIQPVHPKRNQYWILIGRTDVEAENSNTLATWCEELAHLKRPDAGIDWRQEKGTTDDEMVGWNYRFNGHEFE